MWRLTAAAETDHTQLCTQRTARVPLVFCVDHRGSLMLAAFPAEVVFHSALFRRVKPCVHIVSPDLGLSLCGSAQSTPRHDCIRRVETTVRTMNKSIQVSLFTVWGSIKSCPPETVLSQVRCVYIRFFTTVPELVTVVWRVQSFFYLFLALLLTAPSTSLCGCTLCCRVARLFCLSV